MIDDLVGNAHGNLARVREILGSYPGLIDARARWGETPLQAAAQMGNKAIVEYLLDMGAPLDICTAVMLGQRDTVAVLLADNPKLAHATGAHGIPLLYFAAIYGESGIAAYLIKQGAGVNEGDGKMTPLHAAALFNQPEMAVWLLRRKARRNAKNFEGKTPLEVAQEKGHAAVVEALTP
jgi:ankyrin repeat protein